MPYTNEQTIAADMTQSIENCMDCHRMCVQMTVYCLQMGGKYVEASHLKGLLDCAEMCRTSADFMLRGSSLHSHVCGVCAEACERCAQSCSEFDDDAQMQVCAEQCWRCSESCREMARMKM